MVNDWNSDTEMTYIHVRETIEKMFQNCIARGVPHTNTHSKA